jgi:hypothetical protein
MPILPQPGAYLAYVPLLSGPHAYGIKSAIDRRSWART